MADRPTIRSFFDEATNTVSHLVADPLTGAAAVIDPVLDFDAASGQVATASADQLLAEAEIEGWKIVWILETHAHADHLSAAAYLKEKTGATVGIGEGIRDVQKVFCPLLAADDCEPNGGDFDHLFGDGERIDLGTLNIEVIATPGHTPACVSYLIGDALFVGDTLFMPDYGTARTDFPGGDAGQLYRSIRRILSLPEDTRVFMCHDYKAPGRDTFAWETTVGEERRSNPHVHDGISEDEFVAMRESRDATLPVPKLLYPSIQVNIRGGRLPPAEANGRRYIRIPLECDSA
ncbi:MAG TPA: MBL fold metallo-hydrolase [Sphingomicrobium sp.]|nr:MBL fold metallo-hydrolase [Sphingomicrobium sp.]